MNKRPLRSAQAALIAGLLIAAAACGVDSGRTSSSGSGEKASCPWKADPSVKAKATLAWQASPTGDLVVNVRDLEMLDVTGLGMLVGVHRRAGRSGRRLVLREVGPQPDRMLRVSRLHRILAVEASTPV